MFPSNTITFNTHDGQHTIRPVADYAESQMLYHRLDPRAQPSQATRDVTFIAGGALAVSTIGAMAGTGVALTAPTVIDAIHAGSATPETIVAGLGAAMFTGIGALGVWLISRVNNRDLDRVATFGVERDATTRDWHQRMGAAIDDIKGHLKVMTQATYLTVPVIVGATLLGHPWIGVGLAAVEAGIAARFGKKAKNLVADTRTALAVGMAQEEEYAARRASAA